MQRELSTYAFCRGYTDIRIRSVQLPSWVDSFIFDQLGG